MEKFKTYLNEEEDMQRKYNANKKTLQSLQRKAKAQGGHVRVDFKDEKGRNKSGFYNGMMSMGGRTYAKIEPFGKGSMTALPLHHADRIQHVKQ
jgi:hypothetical protein